MFKQIIFYGLRFEQFIDGELVEIGTVRKRTKDHIIGILKRQNYSIINRKRGSAMPSETSSEALNAHHRRALIALLTEGKAPANITQNALMRRGFIGGGAILCVTSKGRDFLNGIVDDTETTELPEPTPLSGNAQSQDIEASTTDHVAPFASDEVLIALRDIRDAALALIENVVSEKAPEVLPVLEQIRRINRFLGE